MLAVFLGALLAIAAEVPLLIPEGTYVQECLHRRQKIHRVEGSKIFSSETNFSDEECSLPVLRIEMVGNYQLTSDGNLDFTFEDVFFIPLQDSVAELYSSQKVCGLEAWKNGEPKSIQGHSCDFFQSGFCFLIPSRLDQRFGLVRIEVDRIWMGKMSLDRDASSPFRRPVEYDPNPYLKTLSSGL